MLTVVKWLTGLLAVSMVSVVAICVIAITDHNKVNDMKDVVVEMKKDTANYGKQIERLEHRIAYYNRVDHPDVSPNGDIQ